MELQHIEIDKLKVSTVNMRHGRQVPDISDILPSVKARGVLAPLLVRPNGDATSFEIVAGRRRYYAAMAVAKEAGEIAPLPCAVMAPGDDVAALEASLIENLARLDPDEMTQYETFVKLTKAGKSISEIASTFGITEVMVKRRLALGNLLPRIREAYRQEEIDAETIRHLTLATKAQQKNWLALYEDPKQYAPRAWQLKQWLFGGQEISTEAALFPLAEYSGHIVADLFGERSYFADADLFWTLQNQAVAQKRDALLAKGWSAVEILEPGERFHVYEHEATPKEEGGRVYIAVSYRGEVEVHEGYVTEKEARRKRRSQEAAAGRETDAEVKAARPEITKAMQNYLELHRHAAVRRTLLSNPCVALRLMVAHAIGGSGLWSVSAEPQKPAKKAIGESLVKSKAQTAFEAERKEILELLNLPQHGYTVTRCNGDCYRTTQVFATLLTLSDESVLRVVAFVMAETLESGSSVVEALGNHLQTDMAEAWEPDEAFFDLLKDRTVINAMLKQVAGKRVADGNVTATGKVQKQIIRDCLAGINDRKKMEGWLPNYMAVPFKAYTKNGGIGIENAWNRIKSMFKAV